MSYAGYSSTLKVSGTAVPVTGEACSVVTAGSVYQVTATGRRIVEPTATLTVKDNGTTIASTLWTFNYLSGIVTFVGYTATGPVTMDLSYLPVTVVAEVKSSTLDAKAEMLDSTTQDSGGWTQRVRGIASASGSFEFLSLSTADLDTVMVGEQSLNTIHAGGTPKLLELTWGAGALKWRGWVLLSGISTKSESNGLVSGTCNFESSSIKPGAGFGFAT
jgi:hypothetical protein